MSKALIDLENFYKSKKYQSGIDYMMNNQDRFDPEIFHYNLGSFYAKSNNLSLARFHFERSKDLGFSSSELEHNLKLIQETLELKDIERPELFQEKSLIFFDELSSQWLLSFFIIFVFLSLYFFKKIHSLVLGLAFLLIGLTPLGVDYYFQSKFSKAVIVKPTSLYDGPSEVFEEVGDLPLGLKVYMTNKRDDSWYFIEYPEPYRGWVNYSKFNFLREKKNVF